MGLWPTQGDEKRFGPATTLYETVALSFVIPSEADLSRRAVEGSVVPRTFRGNAFRPSATVRNARAFSRVTALMLCIRARL